MNPNVNPEPISSHPLEVRPKKNPFKVVTVLLALLLAAAVGYIVYSSITGRPTATTTTKPVAADAYTINLAPSALTASSALNSKLLTISDISDSFAKKYLTIKEWGLKIETKYADLLEYQYVTPDKSWGSNSSPYADCNGSNFTCNSVVAVKIKEQYIDLSNDASKGSGSYTNTSAAGKNDLRTVAYILENNKSISEGATTMSRYWMSDAFTTQYGNTGTLLFVKPTPLGIDELGNAKCGVDLNVHLESSTPCEDMFMSLYRFNASKA